MCHDEVKSRMETCRGLLIRLQEENQVSEDCEPEVSLLEQVLAEFDVFSRTVDVSSQAAHDFILQTSQTLRQTTSVLTGALDMLKTTELSSVQSSYSKYLSIGTSSLITIVNDLLSYAQLQSGELEVREHVFDLLAMLENLVAFYSGRLSGGDVKVFFRYDRHAPREIIGDANRLQQIVNSVLDLSSRRVLEGSIKINVSWGKEDEFPLCITVEDSGLESIKSVSPEGPQVAMGQEIFPDISLSIAQRLIDLLRGKFSYESVAGVGNRYKIECPFTNGDTSPPDHTREKVFESFCVLSGSEALIQEVDDAVSSLGLNFYSMRSLEGLKQALRNSQLSGRCCFCFDKEFLYSVEEIRSVLRNQRVASHSIFVLLRDVADESNIGDASDYGFIGDIDFPVLPTKLESFVYHDLDDQLVVSDDSLSDLLHASSHDYCRVLLVEDNQFNALVLDKMLSSIHCSVTLAHDGLVALDFVDSQDFDLILMDCVMPGMSGIEVTEKIREKPGKLSNVPIVAITANCDAETRKRCISCGMVDFLSKPVQMAMLHKIVERWGSQNSSISRQPTNKNELLDQRESGYPIFILKRVCESFLQYIDEWKGLMRDAVISHDCISYHRYSYYFRSTFSLMGKEDAYVLFRDLEHQAMIDKWHEIDSSWDLVESHVAEVSSISHARLGLLESDQVAETFDHECAGVDDSLLSSAILVIDSDPVYAVIYGCLEQCGFKVFKASTLVDAITLVSDVGLENFYCVICSDNTDDLDPFSSVNFITDLDHSISTILMAHYPTKELVQRAAKEHVFELLSKPANQTILLKAVVSAVQSTRKLRHSEETRIAVKKVGSSQFHLLSRSLRDQESLMTDVCFYPKQDAGGDFFVKLKVGEGHHVLLMTDVSGHDLEAAFVSAYFHGMIRGTVVGSNDELESALASFNEFLISEWNGQQEDHQIVEKSIVVCAVDINEAIDRVQYHLAGSCIPYVVKEDHTIREVACRTGNPLGWFDEAVVEKTLDSCRTLDEIYIWTDGVEDLAHSLQLNLMSILTSLILQKNRSFRPKWMTNMDDDILVVRVSRTQSIFEKTFFPIFYEQFHGNDASDIDLIQQGWERTLFFFWNVIPEDLKYNILLCSREALLNKLKHGCAMDPHVSAYLQIAFDRERSLIRVVVEDEGIPFDYVSVLAKEKMERSYCGSNLIQEMSDNCRYDKGGHRVTLDFNAASLSSTVFDYETKTE